MMDAEVGRLADEAAWLSLRLAETAMLLAVAAQYAWMMAWVDGIRWAEGAISGDRRREARTSRLIRRGIPAGEAARGLRLL